MNGNPSSSHAANSSEVPQRPLWQAILLPLIILIAAIGVWILVVSRSTPAPTALPTPPTIEVSDNRGARQQLYSDKVVPHLKVAEQANREAADRALVRLGEVFDKYRSGVQPFAEDITSIGTRLGITRRMAAEWWNEDERVRPYVQSKFEQHLFSEQQLESDLNAVFEALVEDLKANENRLLANSKASIQTSSIANPQLLNSANYSAQVQSVLQSFSTSRATGSVYHGLTTLAVSEIVAVAAVQIVVSVAANAGGTAAGLTATGAAAGSPAGPIGTAIGLGVGLVIGALIDWYMTEQLQEEMRNDLNTYIESLQISLLVGTGASPGLQPSLSQYIENLNTAQAEVMQKAIGVGP